MSGADSTPTRHRVEPSTQRNRSTLLAQVVRVGCKLVSVMFLARLVSPADHGLYAMAASITYFLVLFRDVGLGTAAVQVTTLSDVQLSTLCRVHLIIGVILAGLTALLAPLAAWFYGTPELVPLLATMATAFLFMGGSGFPRAQLARDLRFVDLARIEVMATIAATIAMIIAGALGAGAYSFAVFLLITEALALILAWRAYPRWPRHPPEFGSLRDLYRTGSQVTGYHLMNCLLMQLDTFAIGQAFGPRILGLYNRPAQLLALGNQHIAAPLAQVALATLSRLGAQSREFGRQATATATIIGHLSLPLTTVCIAVPEEIVQLVLGRQWSDSALILRLLALSAAVGNLTTLAFAVNVAAGQTGKLFWAALAALPPTALAIGLGLGHGAVGVAAGLAVVNAVLVAPRLWWMLRGSPIGLADYSRALIGPVTANFALALGLVGGRMWAGSAEWPIRLGAALAGGVATVTLAAACWPRLRQEGHELLTHLPWRRSEFE